MEAEQLLLLPFNNPWTERFGNDFFKTIPRSPGIYRMWNAYDQLLYVGKAKDLRARLLSYKRARPHQVSRKVIRLIHLAKKIDWEIHSTEMEALLRENELLRDLHPPFNVVNTRHKSYLFIAIRPLPGEMRFRISRNPKKQGDLLFGAFKGRKAVEQGMSALLRTVWACFHAEDRWDYPQQLTRFRPPMLYSVPFLEEWQPSLRAFLSGKDVGFLFILTEKLLQNEKIPRWVRGIIQEDLENLSKLFETQFTRHHSLRKASHIRGRLIAQEKIDDLLVLDTFRRKAELERRKAELERRKEESVPEEETFPGLKTENTPQPKNSLRK